MQSTNSTAGTDTSGNTSNDPNSSDPSGNTNTAQSTADGSSSTDPSSGNNATNQTTSDGTSSTDPSSAGNNAGQSSDPQPVSTGDTDSDGFKLLDSGSWNGSSTSNYQGGQAMHFAIKNANVLGTTITIDSNLGGSQSLLILPAQSVDMKFTCFGSEPMGWTFNVSSDSDAFIVAWKLYSSWVPGDPPNG